MRYAAVVIGLLGVLDLQALPGSIPSAGNPKWPLMLSVSLLGCLLIWIAIGTWQQRILAWQLGFMVIALGAALFVVGVCFNLPAVSIVQKIIIVGLSSICGTLVAAYWSLVWYRQKKWFLRDDSD
jgi:hypothetical protein